MAQDFTQQQLSWIGGFQQQAMQLLAIADGLAARTTTFSDQQFGTGGANAITDTVAQTAIPQTTAAGIAGAEGAIVSILTAIASNRGYLEAIRP